MPSAADGGNIELINSEEAAAKLRTITLQAGKGAPSVVPDAKDGCIVFKMADGVEVLRFEPNGDVLVRGEKVESNSSIFAAFRSWLLGALPSLTEGGSRS